jgi:hypothetical protein
MDNLTEILEELKDRVIATERGGRRPVITTDDALRVAQAKIEALLPEKIDLDSNTDDGYDSDEARIGWNDAIDTITKRFKGE